MSNDVEKVKNEKIKGGRLVLIYKINVDKNLKQIYKIKCKSK